MIPNCHQVTFYQVNDKKRINKFRHGTWNARTLAETGKLENIKEMDKMTINILGISMMEGTWEDHTEHMKTLIFRKL